MGILYFISNAATESPCSPKGSTGTCFEVPPRLCPTPYDGCSPCGARRPASTSPSVQNGNPQSQRPHCRTMRSASAYFLCTKAIDRDRSLEQLMNPCWADKRHIACRYDERSIRKCSLEAREGHEIDGLSSAKAQSTFGQSVPHGRTIPFVLLASCGIKARGSDEEVRHD